MRSWCWPRSTSTADGCANATAKCAATCSPFWNIPTFRPTTMAVSGNCGPQQPTGKSPADSARVGVPTCSLTYDPFSEPQRDRASMLIRLFSPFCAVDQCSRRVEQIRCRACEAAVVQAPAPPRPIDGGLPTAALMAHIAVSKFAWHLPLHRQTQMLAGHGIHLDRSTLVHWIERAAWWLKPLHDLLLETVMAAGKIFCDDTPLPVLDHSRKRTRIGRIWCYALDDRPWNGPAPPVLVYLYAPDRRGSHLEDHLGSFHGVLQVDGYSGYDKLARPGRPAGAIKLAYCLAHARREFFDVHKQTKDVIAEEALRRISEIYVVEARIRGRAASDRAAVRQAETKPLMEALWSWLMERLEAISAKSSLASAIRYTLGHWKGLTLFLSDGRVEVDNNTVERGIRPIPLGRKNSLFAGSDSGGERWAILASLINTAKLHDIDPQTYLADVLDCIVSGRTKVNALRELLPWEWKAAREAAAI